MSQHDAIIAHMDYYGRMTSIEGATVVGTSCFQRRLSDLRAMGYVFSETWEAGYNRYGNPSRWKVYSIKRRPKKGKR